MLLYTYKNQIVLYICTKFYLPLSTNKRDNRFLRRESPHCATARRRIFYVYFVWKDISLGFISETLLYNAVTLHNNNVIAKLAKLKYGFAHSYYKKASICSASTCFVRFCVGCSLSNINRFVCAFYCVLYGISAVPVNFYLYIIRSVI